MSSARATARKQTRFVRPGSLLAWYSNWRSLPVLSWIKGAELLKSENYSAAAACYLKGLRDHADHRAANCARLDYGRCLAELGRLGEAELVLEEAFFSASARRPAPLNEVALLLVRIKHMMGKNADAAYVLRKQLSKTPADPVLLIALAHLLRRTRTEEEAGEAGQLRGKLLAARQRLDIDDPLVGEVNCAVAALELTFLNADEGRLLLSRVLAAGEAPVEAYLLHAQDLLERGREDLAFEALRRAVERTPGDFEAPLLLAKCYLREGRAHNPIYAQQLAASSAARSHWSNPEALLALAESYTLMEDESSAALFRRQVLRLSAGAAIDTKTLQRSGREVERLRLI